MFIGFLYELRRRKVPVGTHEAVALAQALAAGLHDSSLNGFYTVARSLLVHDEKHFDAFDQAFATTFQGAQLEGPALFEALLQWLEQAAARKPLLTDQELRLLEQFDLEQLRREFEARLREQKERHDGGNKWIGTAGTSPFGHSGRAARPGIRVGGAGGLRSAVDIAQSRAYLGYRDDLILDVRQMSLALRKLKNLSREGHEQEVDIDQTVDATAKNDGDLDIVTRPPRKSNTRVILLMDVGGSMTPYSQLMSRLFTAAKKATHFRELRSYYFHNCVYGRVFKQASFREAVTLSQLFAETDRRYKLIVVGDALMGPWELMSHSGLEGEQRIDGYTWLMRLRTHFPASAWLNPEPPSAWWQTTVEAIGRVFPMFALTLSGLGDAVTQLKKT